MDDWIKEIPLEKIIEWRRHLHQHPELSFKEIHTSQFIYDTLSTFPNLEIQRPTLTSVVAILVGGAGVGKTIALRADIDALPIYEEADVEFKSKFDGIMHACGHDTHTAMLLGVAFVLSQMKELLTGKVKFIFQHGEEQNPGGAQELIDLGVIDDVDEIYGLHIMPNLEVGTIVLTSGLATTAADGFFLTIKENKSKPSSVNLNEVGKEVLKSLQNLASHYPSEVSILSVQNDRSKTEENQTVLSCSIRSINEEIRDLVEIRVKNVVAHVTASHGVKYDLKYVRGYSSLYNSPDLVEKVKKAATKVLGEKMIHESEMLMASEDFSAYTKNIKGCFIWLGGGTKEKGYGFINHHPKFKVSEDAFIHGVKVEIQIILDELMKG